MAYNDEEQDFLRKVREVGRKLGSLDRYFADLVENLKQDGCDEVFIGDVVLSFERGVQEGVTQTPLIVEVSGGSE